MTFHTFLASNNRTLITCLNIMIQITEGKKTLTHKIMKSNVTDLVHFPQLNIFLPEVFS